MKYPFHDLKMFWLSMERLLLRQINLPKFSFHACWIGLLIPFCFSVLAVAVRLSHNWQAWWQIALLGAWIASGILFLYLWAAAPKHKENYRNLIVASTFNRTVAFVLFFFDQFKVSELVSYALTSFVVSIVMRMFEDAYDNCVRCQSPN